MKKQAQEVETKSTETTIDKQAYQIGEDQQQERAVLVTTEHRGVFFGYARNTFGPTIRLRKARMCVYWTTDLRGFMGLASQGPGRGCRVGPAADIELRGVTSVVEVSREAVARWEAAPWSN